MFSLLLLSFLTLTQSYDLPIYGCAVRQLNEYSKCVYIPGYFGVNFFGAKCVTYNVDSSCTCIGEESECYPSSNCPLHEEDCFWDWRGGQEECQRINGPANRLKCSRNEWSMPLNQPGECALRKVSRPKCKVNIRPIYYDPYEIYECITESYSANCTYVDSVCVPTEVVPKSRMICKGCFRDKEDLLNRCEREGIPNDKVYECSDNLSNVISDVIKEEKEKETEGISQKNMDDGCLEMTSISSKTLYSIMFVYIFLFMILN
jgi:hypothetical protein